MIFRDLPEGHYYITEIDFVSNRVFVQCLENPETMHSYVFEHYTIEVINDGRSYFKKYGPDTKILDSMEVDYKTFDEVKKERKSRSARISHITRRLNASEPLKGKTLELALDLIGDGTSGDQFYDGIAKKLIEGRPLDEYEHHMMVDVRLVHARLSR